MPIEKLDHVNVRTTQLDAMIAWYTTVLGLRQGERPDFPFGGAWIYAGDSPVVHLVEIDGDPAIGSEAELKLEHFAFSSTGRKEFENHLNTIKERFRMSEVASVNLVQYNLWDPDGNHIHIDFKADD